MPILVLPCQQPIRLTIPNTTAMASIETSAATLAEDVIREFIRWRGDAIGVRIARAPGRVNLIGEHTDYNDGYVLPMTIGCSVVVAARVRKRGCHRVRSDFFGEDIDIPVGERPGRSMPRWASYVAGMLREIHALHGRAAGLEILIVSDVPIGAGLSSSAALEMAVGMAAADLARIQIPAKSMARIGQKVEHTYAHVHCGIMDQIACRLGKRGHALFLDCRTLRTRAVPLPGDQATIVVVDSGVRRALAASKYNERRNECAQSLAYFQRLDRGISALRDVSPEMFQQHRRGIPAHLQRRTQHVIEENARVRESVKALEDGDLAAFGACMWRSHDSLRELYEVSCHELDVLVEAARQIPGVLGARMTGGGFGGCTVNMVQPSAASQFCDRILAAYQDTDQRTASVMVVKENLQAGIVPLT